VIVQFYITSSDIALRADR